MRRRLVRLLIAVPSLGLAMATATPSRSAEVFEQVGVISHFEANSTSAADIGLGLPFALAAPGPFALHHNPATLAYAQPLSFGYSESELRPDSFPGLWLRSYGVAYERNGIGFGVSRLSHKVENVVFRTAFDPEGQSQRLDLENSVWEFGAAVSFAKLLRRDRDPEDFDILIGAGLKRVSVPHISRSSASDEFTTEDVSAFALDAGIVILRDITKVLGGAASTAGNSFALRAAASMDDVTGAKMDYPGLGRIGSLSRVIHYGLAFDGKMHPTPHLGPLFAFSALFERSDAVHGPTVIYSAGLEITAAGILSLRIGNYNHSSDALDSATFGIGVSLDFLGLPEGARIDYAKRPEIGDLDQPDTISVILSSSRF